MPRVASRAISRSGRGLVNQLRSNRCAGPVARLLGELRERIAVAVDERAQLGGRVLPLDQDAEQAEHGERRTGPAGAGAGTRCTVPSVEMTHSSSRSGTPALSAA